MLRGSREIVEQRRRFQIPSIKRLTIAIISALLVIAGLVAVLGYGAWRGARFTRQLRADLDAARRPLETRSVDFRELEGLSAPVQRYFRTALQEGQPLVTRVHVQHQGVFNTSETGEDWKPFTSDQVVITRRPGFDWFGRIKMMPGVTVQVHDAYVAGEGRLCAKLLGLIPLVNVRDTAEVAEGELMRFFAETAWYPTALLPSQGVRWEAVDESSARASLVDGAIAVTMLFRFGKDGLIETVRAEKRGRMVGKQIVPTPWQGRFWNYEERSGMMVPLDGEVAWLLPEGEKPYWRGHITQLNYEVAQ